MASERDTAKRAIKGTDLTDPKLSVALAEGRDQYRIAAENNRHKEAIQVRELGWLGRWLGDEKSAPIAIAAAVVIAGLLGAFLSGYAASQSQRPEAAEYWSKMVDRSIALVTGGLAYIFGRSGRR